MSTKYSREEAEEILRVALQREAAGLDEDAIGHSDLRAAAEEVGISPEALDQAAAEIALEQKRLALQDAVLLRRQREFRRTALSVGFIGAIVVGFGLLTPPAPWIGAAVLIWLGLRARRAFIPTAADLERASLKEGERDRKRSRKQRARERRAIERDERELRKARTRDQFERLVNHGVDALLTAAADKLDEMNEESKPPPAAAPRVRVDGKSSRPARSEPHDDDTRDDDQKPRRGGV